MVQAVLVAGATGRQGGAVVRALLQRPETWQVRGLTRNPHGPQAMALTAHGVEMVHGDLADPATLEPAVAGAYAVFSVQDFRTAGPEGETRQGINLADIAKASGVQHLIYTSVGGADRRSGVPHFESKCRVEEHIRSLGIPASILRPTSFMEGFAGRPVVRSLALGMFAGAFPPNKPLQMIATGDIGIFARIMLERPDEFLGRALELAGDELTITQIVDIISRVTGKRIRYPRIPSALTRRMGDSGQLLRWLGDHGYRADIPTIRKIHPRLLTFEDWLRADRT